MKEASKNTRKNKKNGEFGSALVVPNDVTFIGVLMACSHARMMEEGKRHFRSMSQEYGLKPREAHFGCMGLQMQWCGGLCSAHAASTETLNLARKLEPSYAGDDVALSNIYVAKGMWDRKMIVRDRMKQRRSPGCSLIEVGRSIGEFVSADVDHPLRTEIYQILRQLIATAAAKSPPLSTNPPPF
ncbi:hypothetical protein ACFX1R_041052 [Malus domestica]